MPRKKTEEIAIVPDTPVLPVDDAVEESLPECMSEPVTEDITPKIVESPVEEPEDTPETPPKRTVRRRTTTRKKQPAAEPETPPAEDATEEPEPDTVQPREILTVDARDEAETQEQREDIIWHEIHTGYRTRRILTGMLSGIEKTDAGRTIAIVDYKGFRIVIPLREMVLDFPKGLYGIDYDEMILNYQKILNKMLGAEVDFVIKGIDGNSRSVVASRKDAMLKKQQIYYFGTDSDGQYRICAGRVVQARVVAVSERVIRVEVFGVETSILSRDLSWDWIGDANDRFSVGDHVLVRVAAQFVHACIGKQFYQNRSILYGIICTPFHHRSIQFLPSINECTDYAKLCNTGVNFLQQGYPGTVKSQNILQISSFTIYRLGHCIT